MKWPKPLRHIQVRYSIATTNKVFCIGRNKTGTTTVETVLKEWGYRMGNQAAGENLLDAYTAGNWDDILRFCNTAEAFQDAPFSWPGTWKELAKQYPQANYILSIRPAEEWYRSLVNYHSTLFGQGQVPTAQQLQAATYRYKGWAWQLNRALYNTPAEDPYCKEILIENYNRHNNEVLRHFSGMPNFLAIAVDNPNDYRLLAELLNKPLLRNEFPVTNSSSKKPAA